MRFILYITVLTWNVYIVFRGVPKRLANDSLAKKTRFPNSDTWMFEIFVHWEHDIYLAILNDRPENLDFEAYMIHFPFEIQYFWYFSTFFNF